MIVNVNRLFKSLFRSGNHVGKELTFIIIFDCIKPTVLVTGLNGGLMSSKTVNK